MATLMTLPLEIREMILEFVLLSSRPTPGYLDSTSYDYLPRWWHGAGYWGSLGYLKWPTSQTPHPAVALLEVNRQPRHEAKLVRKRLGCPRVCHVDIKFVDEVELRPSFLSLNNTSPYLDTVQAQIRTVGLYGRKTVYKGDCSFQEYQLRAPEDFTIWMERGRGIAAFDSMFVYMFRQFLALGPLHINAAEARAKEEDCFGGAPGRRITISTLEIDVFRPEDGSLVPNGDEEGARKRRQPRWLCEQIMGQFDLLLRLKERARYWGNDIYKQVGTVKVFFEGKFEREFNIGKMFCDPKLKEIRGYHEWSAGTIMERRKNGLPVVLEEESAGKEDFTI